MDEPDRLELGEAAEAEELAPVAPIDARRGARNPLRSLKDRDFAIAWSGVALSNIGSWAQSAVVPFVVYDLTRNAAIVGLTTFLAFVPALLLGPLGGVSAERFDRRRVVLVTCGIAALATTVLWASWVSGHHSVVLLIACVMVASTANGLGHPAWQALVYDLADPADAQNAITLNSGQFNLARAVGPAMAGVLYARYGAGAVFGVNAVSFLFAIGAMLLVHTHRTKHHRNPSATIRDGFRYMSQRPALLLPPVIIGIGIMASIPIIQLVPVIASDVLHVGPERYGYLTAMFGLGGVVGAVLIGSISHLMQRSVQIVSALIGVAIMVAALGIASSYVTALIAMFGIGIGFLTLASGTNTALQASVDNAYRGRVLAIYFMVVTATVPFYALLFGWIAQHLGIEPLMLMVALVEVGLGVVLVVRPGLRALLDRTRPGEPPSLA